MHVERTVLPGYLTNSFLVFDHPGGDAVLVDAGGPMEAHLQTIEEASLTLGYVLLTHHHPDHVLNAEKYREALGCMVAAHEFTGARWGRLDKALEDGDLLQVGDMEIRTVFVPGHTLGHLAFVVNDERVFTGDTLFRGSVGGTRGQGHGTCGQLRASIMEKLMRLPDDCIIHPGHVADSNVGHERETNPFVQAWKQDAVVHERQCEAFGTPATVLVSAPDYDGGTKHWVRFADGSEDIAPGSKVLLHD